MAEHQAACHTRAIIGHSATNHGGRSSGMTAPNGPAQTSLIRGAISAVGELSNAACVHSLHGTGTPLGDPIEIGALGRAVSENTATRMHINMFSLMSSKSCMGHTEGAAGVAGLLLSITSMRSQQTPGIMHLRVLNPYVAAAWDDWRDSDVATYAPRQRAPCPGHTLRAASARAISSTSSFGMSGINAFMLVTHDTSDGYDAAAILKVGAWTTVWSNLGQCVNSS